VDRAGKPPGVGVTESLASAGFSCAFSRACIALKVASSELDVLGGVKYLSLLLLVDGVLSSLSNARLGGAAEFFRDGVIGVHAVAMRPTDEESDRTREFLRGLSGFEGDGAVSSANAPRKSLRSPVAVRFQPFKRSRSPCTTGADAGRGAGASGSFLSWSDDMRPAMARTW